jgi:hypothetical protein
MWPGERPPVRVRYHIPGEAGMAHAAVPFEKCVPKRFDGVVGYVYLPDTQKAPGSSPVEP